jgi:flagellin FlaB
MTQLQSDENGFTGLEAAIVLIAFVVVAAVFSYVVLGAGFFATERASETVYRGVETTSTNIQMIGNMYGIASNPENGIDEIWFTIGLAPGSSSVDLTKMKIIFSTPATVLQTLSYKAEGNPSLTEFSTELDGKAVDTMAQGQQVEVRFMVAPVPANTKMNIELRPAVGAALPFAKISPVTITKTNVL